MGLTVPRREARPAREASLFTHARRSPSEAVLCSGPKGEERDGTPERGAEARGAGWNGRAGVHRRDAADGCSRAESRRAAAVPLGVRREGGARGQCEAPPGGAPARRTRAANAVHRVAVAVTEPAVEAIAQAPRVLLGQADQRGGNRTGPCPRPRARCGAPPAPAAPRGRRRNRPRRAGCRRSWAGLLRFVRWRTAPGRRCALIREPRPAPDGRPAPARGGRTGGTCARPAPRRAGPRAGETSGRGPATPRPRWRGVRPMPRIARLPGTRP